MVFSLNPLIKCVTIILWFLAFFLTSPPRYVSQFYSISESFLTANQFDQNEQKC
jgi:hypothetical protein